MGTAFIPKPLIDSLPSMIGFDSERLGFPESEWTSPCYLLADRNLAENEVISVWAVDKVDGRVLKTVELEASGEICKRDNWPAALVKLIRDDDTLVEGSKLLHAGRINGDAFDTGPTALSTSNFTSAASLADYDRLWVYSSKARLFTNAPFICNQVIANNLADVEFATSHRFCVQVRDSVSQHLHESIVVSVAQTSDARARAEALCKSVAQRSRMLRAGVLNADGLTIAVESQGNALWIPQSSGLSVTVDSANWLDHGDFNASRALATHETLRIHAHDDITGLPLAGSPFVFAPAADALEVAKWPKALAAALKASALGTYLSLELDSAAAPVTGKWQRAGIPLRIWMSSPLQEDTQWVPMQPEPGQPDRAVTVKEWLSGMPTLVKPAPNNEHWAVLADSGHIKEAVCLVELQDRRTGHVCYRWKVDGTKIVKLGRYNPLTNIDTRKEERVMRTEEEFCHALCATVKERLECRTDMAQSTGTSSDAGGGVYTLWLPADIDMTAVLRWVPKAEKIEILKRSTFSTVFELPEPYLPYVCTGDTLTTAPVKGVGLQLRLRAESINQGIRILPSRDGRLTAELLLPCVSALMNPEVIGGFITPLCPWHEPFHLGITDTASNGKVARLRHAKFCSGQEKTIHRVIKNRDEQTSLLRRHRIYLDSNDKLSDLYSTDPIASFNPDNTLCADRCMTLGAQVYDTGGAQENGVDENTGLFHAHYPLATLRGLGGKGPELSITLHYSAVRANEGALGDGWAFRFSSFDNRRRVLTLSTGQTVTLTKNEMGSLSKDKNRFLDKQGFSITGVEGSEDGLTRLTIRSSREDGGREEVLTLPAVHDHQEAGEAFKNRHREKLKQIIDNLTRWIEEETISSDEIENFKKQRTGWQAELADIDRPALLLVTSSVRSPMGGELHLKWQGINGHVQLLSITDKPSDTILLHATHDTPVTRGSTQSHFTVWPTTTERYEVTLDIRNCLLESITRHSAATKEIPERHVRFGYELNYALDRVLTSITEEDGSTEAVLYKSADFDIAPRAELHTMIPGAGQPCITHNYDWEGDYRVTQVRKCQHSSAGFFAMPCVQTNWIVHDGVRLVSTHYESQPGLPGRTVRFKYPENVTDSACKALVIARPIRMDTTDGQVDSCGVSVESELSIFQKNVRKWYFDYMNRRVSAGERPSDIAMKGRLFIEWQAWVWFPPRLLCELGEPDAEADLWKKTVRILNGSEMLRYQRPGEFIKPSSSGVTPFEQALIKRSIQQAIDDFNANVHEVGKS